MKDSKIKCGTVRVLVVEDDDAANAICTGIEQTSSASMSTQSASSLADALTALAAEAFDLVILNLDLPDSAGVLTLEHVKQTVPDTPVVVLTNTADPSMGTTCIAKGAQNYIIKGHMGSAIASVIHNTITANTALANAVEAHENLKRVLDGSRDAILVMEDDGRVVFTNQAARELFSDRISEGQDIGLVLEAAHAQELSVVAPDRSVASVEMRTGQTMWLGSPAKIVTFRDVTERKRAEQQTMEQLDELRLWHELTLGRESRVMELKSEVNELLTHAGLPPRYA